MRLLICAGMTGGGVYPALAVLQALENDIDQVLWIGSESGLEASLLNQYNLEYQTIPAAGLHGVGLLSVPSNLIQLSRGWLHARKIIKQFKPDVLFFTGGYLGVPVAFAGKKIPSVVFIPDIKPGLALKVVNRFSEKTAIISTKSKEYLREQNVIVTGYPLRSELANWDRKKGREHFNISFEEKVLLVFGGSKGARSINNALIDALPALLERMHVIHITGKDLWEEVLSGLGKEKLDYREHYHSYPFLGKEMGAALAAADLVVCRAGASTLGELPHFALPAILVPYPHAWDYQHKNAEALSGIGGAVILEDDELEVLPMKILSLINNEKMLSSMGNAMISIATPDAAGKIAKLIAILHRVVKRRYVMVSLDVLFYIFIIMFALIGAIRGWAKEVTALFGSVLALFILTVMQSYIPAVKTYLENSPVASQVIFKFSVLGIIAFIGYQTPNLPIFMQSPNFKRNQMQDVILGFLIGGVNGFMIFGSFWYFMDLGGYPFSFMLSPIAGTPAGEAALQILPLLPPNWLVAPGIYFAIAISFMFVLMVFI